MKCPKCGYNSFESNDICKKCSNDLSGYKQTYGITPIVLPLEIRAEMAEQFRAASAEVGQQVENVETHDDMFAFDLPEEKGAEAEPFNDDPFNFDDQAPVAGLAQARVEEDPFADLLETTPQVSNDPFGAPTPAAPKVAAPTSTAGEFDLESFSWDDTPETVSDAGGQVAADDFDSLFGDSDESAKK